MEMLNATMFSELSQKVATIAENQESNRQKVRDLAKSVNELKSGFDGLKEVLTGLLTRFPVPTTPTRAIQSGYSSNPSGKAMIEPEPPDLVGSGNLKTGGVMIVDEPLVHDEISTTKLVAMKEISDLDACQLFDELPKSASINDSDLIEQEGLERVESMVAKEISVPDQHAIKCSLIFLTSKLVKKNARSNSTFRFAEVLESNDVLKQEVKRAYMETIDESNDEEEAADLVAHQVFDEMSKPLFSYETESLQEVADFVTHQVFDEMSKRLFSYETESLLQTAEEVHCLKISAVNFLNNATLLLLVRSDFTHKLMLPRDFCDSIDYLKTVCFDLGGKRLMLDEWVLYLSTESELACNDYLVVALIQLMPKAAAIIDVLKLLPVNRTVHSASKISGLDKILELNSRFIAIEITHGAAIESAIFWDETQIQPEDFLPYFLLSNVEINQIRVLTAAGHFDSIKTSIMVFIFDPGGGSYFYFATSIVRGPSQQCCQRNYKLLGVVLMSIVHNWTAHLVIVPFIHFEPVVIDVISFKLSNHEIYFYYKEDLAETDFLKKLGRKHNLQFLSCSTSYDVDLVPCAIILAHLIAAGFAQFTAALAIVFGHKIETLKEDQLPKFMEQTTDYFQGDMKMLCAITGRFGDFATALI